jgi:hypothetical protein
VNPALLELRTTIELPDPEAALSGTVTNSIRFWSSEDAVLRQLYGAAAIDPAAQDLVDRQRADRCGELTRLAARLEQTGRLRPGVDSTTALATLLVLTSYETYRELRLADLSDTSIAEFIRNSAHTLLLS